jgi:hypothetical protein
MTAEPKCCGNCKWFRRYPGRTLGQCGCGAQDWLYDLVDIPAAYDLDREMHDSDGEECDAHCPTHAPKEEGK